MAPPSQTFFIFFMVISHHRLRLMHHTQFCQRVSNHSVALAASCSSDLPPEKITIAHSLSLSLSISLSLSLVFLLSNPRISIYLLEAPFLKLFRGLLLGM